MGKDRRDSRATTGDKIPRAGPQKTQNCLHTGRRGSAAAAPVPPRAAAGRRPCLHPARRHRRARPTEPRPTEPTLPPLFRLASRPHCSSQHSATAAPAAAPAAVSKNLHRKQRQQNHRQEQQQHHQQQPPSSVATTAVPATDVVTVSSNSCRSSTNHRFQ